MAGKIGMHREPKWWPRAQEMRSRGLTLREIGMKVGKHWTTVQHAVDAEWREEKKERLREYYRRTGNA